MNKTDLRVIKTKKALYNALIELMKEKTFEEIKVSDICDKALVNRSTFYSHFEDKYELLQGLINDLKNDLQEELKKNENIISIKDYYIGLIKVLLDHIESNMETYRSVAINNRNSIIMDIINDVIEKDILYHIKDDDKIKSVPKEFVSKFFIGAAINTGIYWIYNPNKYTKEEVLNYFIVLIPNEITK